MSPKAWRRTRTVTQILSLLLFFYLFWHSTYLSRDLPLNNLFFRLDPLVAISAMVAGRVFIATLGLAGITILFTVVFGRAWCGWICPLGSLLEWCSPRKKRAFPKKNEANTKWRTIKYLLVIGILGAAVLGNQTLILLDPITILNRSLAGSIWPALRFTVLNLEGFFYQYKVFWPALDWLHTTVILPLFQNIQSVFISVLPVFIFFLILISLNWLAERFWCRYLCPLGGLLGWFSRLAFLRRKVTTPCKTCGLCSRQCPTGTIDAEKNYRSDPAECILCLNCIEVCNQDSVAFRWHLPKFKIAEKQSYDPGRREALASLAAAAGGVALAGIEPITKRNPARLIRPPGASLTDFASLCIRCGECVRVCPTQGLQPSLLEGGWQNLMTPHLVPRLGYCVYNCDACIRSCPSGAIPLISLDTKHNTPMGLASIDRDRCLPWAYRTPCLVCEEMCPLPSKAIKLEESRIEIVPGEVSVIQLPRVVREMCIGCGICEYHCPVGGEAAIQVFSHQSSNSPMTGL